MVNLPTTQEFIQIDEEYGDYLTQITLGLITTLSQYRTGAKELSQDLKLLLLSEEKLQYFNEVKGYIFCVEDRGKFV